MLIIALHVLAKQIRSRLNATIKYWFDKLGFILILELVQKSNSIMWKIRLKTVFAIESCFPLHVCICMCKHAHTHTHSGQKSRRSCSKCQQQSVTSGCGTANKLLHFSFCLFALSCLCIISISKNIIYCFFKKWKSI